MVLVTTPPQPASNARMMFASDSVGGADDSRNGFLNRTPVKVVERSGHGLICLIGGFDEPERPVGRHEDVVRIVEAERLQVRRADGAGSGIVSVMAVTSAHAARAASPIAYSVCCTERLSCAANVSTSARRIRSRAAKSLVPGRYVHAAVTDVARRRSSVSGSVVYSSRGKPAKRRIGRLQHDEVRHA